MSGEQAEERTAKEGRKPKVTPEMVVAVRKSPNRTLKSLAEEWGVSAATVSNIRSGYYNQMLPVASEEKELRRAREWYRAQLPPPPECAYCGKPLSMTPTAAGIFQYCPKGPTKGQGCTYTFTSTTNLDDGIVECLAKYAQAECSRLASRVEELENLIAKHSGCSHCKDSASGSASANDSTETRESK